MSKELKVRSLLLDPNTKKFIKAIDERDLSDYLSRISPTDNHLKVFIPDMTPAIIEVKSHVEALLKDNLITIEIQPALAIAAA